MKENQSKYINDFIKEKYDTIKIQFPKGYKEKIKTHANAKGYESMNKYIKAIVDKDMENSGDEKIIGGGTAPLEEENKKR